MRQARFLMDHRRPFASPLLKSRGRLVPMGSVVPERDMIEWFSKETLAALERSGVFEWVEGPRKSRRASKRPVAPAEV